jgi:hypothetical protein
MRELKQKKKKVAILEQDIKILKVQRWVVRQMFIKKSKVVGLPSVLSNE